MIFSFKSSIDKRIDYYGDPLMDFSLTRFLDRFAFKNPKKVAEEKEIKSVVQAKHAKTKDYKQHGSRGIPVTALTDRNCTEDERFIFNYLERRRQIRGSRGDDEDSDSEQGDLDDDEFDSYLDGLGSKKADGEDEEMDFMKEISSLPDAGGEAETKGKKRKKASQDDDDDNADGEDDWNEEEDDVADDVSDVSMNGEDISDLSDLGDDSDDEEGAMTFSESDGGSDDDDEEDGGRRKGKKKGSDGAMVSDKEFKRKLKGSADMSSLFAAADDFGELLEATGKIKKHGTTDEVSTKDKASVKQLAWEQNRFKSGGKSRTMGKATLKNKSKKFKK